MNLLSFSESEIATIGKGISYAMENALANKPLTFTVNVASVPEFVVSIRNSNEAKPKNSEVHCMVQYWDDTTVQVRYQGGFSEFIKL